jgi:ATP-dependent protease ClpP protease subunit
MSEEFFASRRTILLGGEITSESIEKVGSQMVGFQCESEEPINLLINSGGGNTFAALQLCDWMEHFLTAPVHGFVIGECSSAATFILLYCEKRSCTRHSYFVVHSTTLLGIEIKADKATSMNLEALLEETRATQETVTEMYMRKLNLERDKVDSIVSRGDQPFNNALSAFEAKEIGLVQEIIENKLDLLAHN